MRELNFSKKKICRGTVTAGLLFFATACNLSFTALEYRRGISAEEKQEYTNAVEHFKHVILRAPESEKALDSSRRAARITLFEMKKYVDAVWYYRHLIKFSKIESERREAQKRIANIYFEKLNDFASAIGEYNKLLLLRNSKEEIVDYRFSLAKAHFGMNNFSDAQAETESALKLSENPEIKFDLLMFLGNIYFNTRHADKAIKVYERVIEEFPEKAKHDNVAMNIIVCYEELEAFDKAITALERLRPVYRDPEFIDLKIKRLKDRRANLPGSKGLRK